MEDKAKKLVIFLVQEARASRAYFERYKRSGLLPSEILSHYDGMRFGARFLCDNAKRMTQADAKILLIAMAKYYRMIRKECKQLSAQNVSADLINFKEGVRLQTWNSFQIAKQIVFHGESIGPAVFKEKF